MLRALVPTVILKGLRQLLRHTIIIIIIIITCAPFSFLVLARLLHLFLRKHTYIYI
jgi:hypothetical protein